MNETRKEKKEGLEDTHAFRQRLLACREKRMYRNAMYRPSHACTLVPLSADSSFSVCSRLCLSYFFSSMHLLKGRRVSSLRSIYILPSSSYSKEGLLCWWPGNACICRVLKDCGGNVGLELCVVCVIGGKENEWGVRARNQNVVGLRQTNTHTLCRHLHLHLSIYLETCQVRDINFDSFFLVQTEPTCV